MAHQEARGTAALEVQMAETEEEGGTLGAAQTEREKVVDAMEDVMVVLKEVDMEDLAVGKEVATRVAPRVVAEGTEVEVIVVKEKEGKEVEVIVVKEKEGTEVEAIVVKEKEVVPQVMVGVWVVELEDTKVELEVMAGAAVAMADKPPLYWAEASQSSSLDRADREATVGDAGFAERSVCTFERCVDSTYSAGSTDGSNTPPARRAFGSVTTRDAPNTAANSYKLRPLTWSPSTS
ncbi:hypothetical protein AB1Y20_017615 [Prymnesium parvum]|uniref:Uncharacterized protein n=1 Tax=Prymnesium parvum TaxID=97485 RepID=A0AB34JMA1_PRYPA